MKMSRITLPLIALAASLAVAQAQAQSEQDTHHDQSGAGSEDSAAGMQMPGMGGQMPMMGQQPGMMSPSMSMQNSNMCPVRGMMMNMTRHGGMARETPVDHIEGRIAYLKAEIKITPDQEDKWKTFAEALRRAATQKNMMHGQMGSEKSMSWQDRLAKHEERLQAHLSLLKSVKDAADPLFASFNDEQREVANELLSGPMGIVR